MRATVADSRDSCIANCAAFTHGPKPRAPSKNIQHTAGLNPLKNSIATSFVIVSPVLHGRLFFYETRQVWHAEMRKPVRRRASKCDSFYRLQRLAAVAMLTDKGLHGFQVVRQYRATLISLKQIRKMCR